MNPREYLELLKAPQWKEFRNAFLEYRRTGQGDLLCDTCGGETLPREPLMVHHRIYRDNRLPWDYEFDDLRLVCRDCHRHIHETESGWRNFIRTLPPHVCCEAEDLLAELKELPDFADVQCALAHAKNAVRNWRWRMYPSSGL